MLLVIFGAGASYDSLPSRPLAEFPKVEARPPLADHLFDDRPLFLETLRRVPQCHPIVARLRHRPAGISLEAKLTELESDASNHSLRRTQLAGLRYYLQVLLFECCRQWHGQAVGVTNYLTLLDVIESRRKKDDRVLLATFNYDTLIEEALSGIGVRLADIGDYIKHPSYRLFKLHGSVNWARRLEGSMDTIRAAWAIAHDVMERIDDLTLTDDYRLISETPAGSVDKQPALPAIAIPLLNKQEYECPSAHVSALLQDLPQVDRVLIIGWAANDEMLLDTLVAKLTLRPNVTIVAGGAEQATQVQLKFRARNYRGGTRVLEGGFTEFVVGDGYQTHVAA
jgi:hypothetical protein